MISEKKKGKKIFDIMRLDDITNPTIIIYPKFHNNVQFYLPDPRKTTAIISQANICLLKWENKYAQILN